MGRRLRRLAALACVLALLACAVADDAKPAPAKPAPAKPAPAKADSAKAAPAKKDTPAPAKPAATPDLSAKATPTPAVQDASETEYDENPYSDSEYLDYEYSSDFDYSAFEDESYFDWFADETSTEWTSSDVPMEDYSYDPWQDDHCDGDDFGEESVKPCDVMVEGGEEAVKLKTKLTGVYKPTGCRNGHPLYKRVKKDKDEEDRFIIFSGYWGDWDFSSKDQLTDDVTLGYGGEGDGERRPELVKSDDWYLRSTLVDKANVTTDFVESLSLTVHCVDTCNDGIQNYNETGIDCGGPCPPCQDLHLDELAERNADLAKDLAALRMKIAAEQKAKEERDQENKVAKVAISFMIVLGAAIVLGGPIIYSLKRGRASGGVGPLYQQVAKSDAGVAMQTRKPPV